MIGTAAWQEEFSMLLWLRSGVGIGTVASMSVIGLWGIYCLLKRLTES